MPLASDEQQQYLVNTQQPQHNSNALQQNPNTAQSITSSARTPTSVKYVFGNVSNMLISTHNYESNATANANNLMSSTV